ncbi:MAG TPA: RHS repeat domain-containing protein [Steroidobacteraceae bacterium]|nr:RHS repeat domain-containing protein [Steroidobacteraceae bacterium]
MSNIFRKKLPFAFFLLLLFMTSGSSVDASNTVTYTYDALGRLTFVNDPLNGNRDYDYDGAGNRLLVSVGTANDAAAEPGSPSLPPAPTGLFSTQNSMCSWQASWSAAAGATSYNFQDVSGNHVLTVTSTQVVYGFSSCSITPSSEKPKWVQACGPSGCSVKAYFP